jgi:hypothetical protein
MCSTGESHAILDEICDVKIDGCGLLASASSREMMLVGLFLCCWQ